MATPRILALGLLIALLAAFGVSRANAQGYTDAPAIYFVQYFDESASGSPTTWNPLAGQKFIHWMYNPSQTEWVKAEIKRMDTSQVLGTVNRNADPALNYYNTASLPLNIVLRVTPRKVDNTAGTYDDVTLNLSQYSPTIPWMGRIGIVSQGGRAVYWNMGINCQFNPRGFNLCRLSGANGWHNTFEAATVASDYPATINHYDPYTATAIFRKMAQYGYNTVRVLLTGGAPWVGVSGSGGVWGVAGVNNGTEGLYIPYLNNVADFIRRGAEYGVYTLLCVNTSDIPENRYVATQIAPECFNGRPVVTSAQGVVAAMDNIGSVLNYLKTKNPNLLKAVLAVQYTSEMNHDLNAWPWNQTGSQTVANGNSYNMSENAWASTTGRRACGEDSWFFYYCKLGKLADSIDSNLMRQESIFPAYAVGRDYHNYSSDTNNPFAYGAAADKRVPPQLGLFYNCKSLNYMDSADVHYYPEFYNFAHPGYLISQTNAAITAYNNSEYYDGWASQIRSGMPITLGEVGCSWPYQTTAANAQARISALRDGTCAPAANGGEGCEFVGFCLWDLDSFLEDIYPSTYKLWYGMCTSMQSYAMNYYTVPGTFNYVPYFPTYNQGASVYDPSQTLYNPLALATVAPTGAYNGYLVSYTLNQFPYP